MGRSLIDNWSLEHAASLLDVNSDITIIPDDSLKTSIGGLSNFVHSILLYDEALFPQNGYESDWKRFEWFTQNGSSLLTPVNVQGFYEWNAPESFEDIGIKNYMVSAERLSSDVYLAPERSWKVSEEVSAISKLETFEYIDKKLDEIAKQAINKQVTVSIQNNFKVPALTHYVLSMASSRADLLTVIAQMTSDPVIQSIKAVLDDASRTTEKNFSLKAEIDNLINKKFKLGISNTNRWQVTIPVLNVLSYTRDLNDILHFGKKHKIFLRNLVALRTEMNSCDEHLKRLFHRSIRF